MIEVRDITSEPELFQTAIDWQNTMPRWWRIADEAIAKVRTAGPVILFGVFDHGVYTALILFQQMDSAIVEAHLNCLRYTDPGIVVAAAKLLAQRFFEAGFEKIVTRPVTINHSLIDMLKAIGFEPTDDTIQVGQIGKRLLYWNRMDMLPSQVK